MESGSGNIREKPELTWRYGIGNAFLPLLGTGANAETAGRTRRDL